MRATTPTKIRVYSGDVGICFQLIFQMVFEAGPSTRALCVEKFLKLPLHEGTVRRAILLGALRKYTAVHQNGGGTPISSLHYFTHLFEEVQQEISTRYWTYVARKLKTFEQTWAGFSSRDTGY